METFRLLVSREPDGVPAGELARLMAVPQNTMSAHLAILARAGLVIGQRQSRSIMYRADLSRFREVTLFLLKDCCGGRPDICAPLVADLTPCCPAEGSRPLLIPSSTFSFFVQATAPARSWRKASFGSWERSDSTPSRLEAIRRA
jgi:ArsR family transcriptional regulator, arsenate/arsenite/antimonite-responsive transcriptional repressor